ncbi:MAG TPA: L,D-transpeptidase family protein [Pseudobacteroides sp.]|uniref:L,D-transpeptidase family protein n=1 Tax=Pseudobacteroides sp. TaxID=1968840 RepID=UPI002F93E4B1
MKSKILKGKSAKLLLYPLLISLTAVSVTGYSFGAGTNTQISSKEPISFISSSNKSISIDETLELIKKVPIVDSNLKKLVKNNSLASLKKLGYYKENFKDKNLNSRSALIHFQSNHNMNPTGKWDKKTTDAVLKKLIAPDLSPSDKVSDIPSEGLWLTINKSKNLLTLYKGGKLVKKYPVAVGNPSTLTPSGKFTIVNKIVNPAWGGGGYAKPVNGGSPYNPLGYRWMGLSLKGGSSYGIHGTTDPYSIGTYASHGCIRMFNFDVESLFPQIPMHTKVYIGTAEELAKWGILQEEVTV